LPVAEESNPLTRLDGQEAVEDESSARAGTRGALHQDQARGRGLLAHGDRLGVFGRSVPAPRLLHALELHHDHRPRLDRALQDLKRAVDDDLLAAVGRERRPGGLELEGR
jgi:3-methyladenine DNA glycosylase/8-oxoguanine DNA glycosylase